MPRGPRRLRDELSTLTVAIRRRKADGVAGIDGEKGMSGPEVMGLVMADVFEPVVDVESLGLMTVGCVRKTQLTLKAQGKNGAGGGQLKFGFIGGSYRPRQTPELAVIGDRELAFWGINVAGRDRRHTLVEAAGVTLFEGCGERARSVGQDGLL